jgi:hypothetical protein
MGLFGEIIAAYYYAMAEYHQVMIYIEFGMCVESLMESWDQYVPSFNPGQVTIYMSSLVQAILDSIQQMAESWPDSDPFSEYVDVFYAYCDGEIVDRAFSATISAPLDSMYDHIEKAQHHRDMSDYYQAMAEIAGYF